MNSAKITCPSNVSFVLKRLREAGHHAYAVGGCIRDTLLGLTPNDWDVTTSARPEEILEAFSDKHTIPTGLKHGTVTVMINKEPIEITTFRIDGAYVDARRPASVTFTDRIAEDLSRRDFTVNALAWNEHEGIVDCHNGTEDLQNSVIRAVGVPEIRFSEDALRILRAYRFSAKLGFSIEKSTRKALISEAYRLKNISRERIASEFCRLITASHAANALRMMHEDGIFPYIFSNEFTLSRNIVDQINSLPDDDFVYRLAFLLRGHREDLIRAWLRSLKLSNAQNDAVLTLCDLGDLASAAPTPYAARFLLSKCGSLSIPLLRIAALHSINTAELIQLTEAATQSGNPVRIADLHINGKDLITEGLGKGPEIGKLLSALLDAVLHDPAKNDRETLLALAKSLRNN